MSLNVKYYSPLGPLWKGAGGGIFKDYVKKSDIVKAVKFNGTRQQAHGIVGYINSNGGEATVVFAEDSKLGNKYLISIKSKTGSVTRVDPGSWIVGKGREFTGVNGDFEKLYQELRK